MNSELTLDDEVRVVKRKSAARIKGRLARSEKHAIEAAGEGLGLVNASDKQ